MPRSPERSDEPMGAPEDAGGSVQENETVTSLSETEADGSVAQRAYERFRARGGEHGRDQEDWFEAERELKESRARDSSPE